MPVAAHWHCGFGAFQRIEIGIQKDLQLREEPLMAPTELCPALFGRRSFHGTDSFLFLLPDVPVRFALNYRHKKDFLYGKTKIF